MQLPLNDNDPVLFAEEGESQYFDRKSARLNPKETARTFVLLPMRRVASWLSE